MIAKNVNLLSPFQAMGDLYAGCTN